MLFSFRLHFAVPDQIGVRDFGKLDNDAKQVIGCGFQGSSINQCKGPKTYTNLFAIMLGIATMGGELVSLAQRCNRAINNCIGVATLVVGFSPSFEARADPFGQLFTIPQLALVQRFHGLVKRHLASSPNHERKNVLKLSGSNCHASDQ
jgi:hypothetical protein